MDGNTGLFDLSAIAETLTGGSSDRDKEEAYQALLFEPHSREEMLDVHFSSVEDHNIGIRV